MPNFSYKALGRDGKEVRGVLQAESEAAAASRIRENYPILLSISQKKEKKRPDEGSLLEMEIGSRRIKTKKLADQDEEAGDPVFTVCAHPSFGHDSGTRDAYAGRSE